MAKVIPFPLVRRVAFVDSIVDQMLRSKPAVAENLLRSRIDVQRRAMLNKGVSADVAASTIAAFEREVRALCFQHGDDRGGGRA